VTTAYERVQAARRKGRPTAAWYIDRLFTDFPEGYRKALRQMKLAEKFRRPVVCLIDTAGAYCGIGAEERGQGQAIAENLTTMMGLTVPIVSVLIGEGGSGGALALGVADRVWMLENAVYSVISPEGAASIVWKDAGKAAEACEALRMTADDLLGFGLVDRVFSEENGDFNKVCAALGAALATELASLSALSAETLTAARYDKFRVMGGEER
jgi:acetyl-CoA carboxylase carboxyl transferase subunit alpha